MDLYLTVDQEAYDRIKNLDVYLGMMLWNLAVMYAPIDTGNLRRAISLASNNSKQIRIQYNLLSANYIKFLEEGLGPVKKYKDFIKKGTTSVIVEQLVSYIQNDNIKSSSWLLGLPPVVETRRSTNIFGQERKVMNLLEMNKKHITANQRKQISKFRERNYQANFEGKRPQNSLGMKPRAVSQSRMSSSLKGRTIVGGI